VFECDFQDPADAAAADVAAQNLHQGRYSRSVSSRADSDHPASSSNQPWEWWCELDLFVAALKHCSSLTNLHVADDRLTDAHLVAILPSMPLLQSLRVDSGHVSSLSFLAAAPPLPSQLNELELRHCEFSPSHVRFLTLHECCWELDAAVLVALTPGADGFLKDCWPRLNSSATAGREKERDDIASTPAAAAASASSDSSSRSKRPADDTASSDQPAAKRGPPRQFHAEPRLEQPQLPRDALQSIFVFLDREDFPTLTWTCQQ
jgi:hypothetical protein